MELRIVFLFIILIAIIVYHQTCMTKTICFKRHKKHKMTKYLNWTIGPVSLKNKKEGRD
jgi:hypothetical protein